MKILGNGFMAQWALPTIALVGQDARGPSGVSSLIATNMMGQCSCGFFHPQGNCFSVLFSMPNHIIPIDEPESYTITSPSSSSVDCTLSLGTPSTRQTEEKSISNHRKSLCWDIFQTNNPPSSTNTHKNSRGGNGNSFNGDPLLSRKCANCNTASTPLWRNGPRGPKSLCNACGIRYKKEERRATTTVNNTSAATGGTMESQFLMSQHHQNSWGHHEETQKVASMSPAGLGNEFRFVDDDDRNSTASTGIPFLSWRLNVPDRPSFVHDFT
ncbi:GATA transcription factor 19-like [Telopea speciosissima]|uniref:GATA transcription factor 19-like n=1 Tax=Telopea speciosissima TaxID=54955 RepID=UPI001CC50298|nr:GATA transcription factor 19-like [Telopea speciosissima]